MSEELKVALLHGAEGEHKVVVEGPEGRFELLADIAQELQEESDRGAAVVAAAVLQTMLGDVLKSVLKDEPKTDQLFDSFGSLGSFGDLIGVGRAVGVLDPKEEADLRIIQKIRDEFAHLEKIDFETPRIKDKVKNLQFAGVDQETFGPRISFVVSVLVLMLEFDGRPEDFKKRWPKIKLQRSSKRFGLRPVE
jgi:mannitol operon repressor